MNKVSPISNDQVITKQTLKFNIKTFGTITSKDSTFEGKIYASKEIKLERVNALKTVVSKQQLRWENPEMIESSAGSIRARNDIKLKGVRCHGKTKSSLGKIDADCCNLKKVSARKDVHLINTFARKVSVLSGGLSIKFSGSRKAVYKMLSARDDISLHSIKVSGKVVSEEGVINAERCSLNKVFSCEGLSLIDTPAKTCKDTNGSIAIISTGSKLSYGKIRAQKNIFLKNISVKRKVKTKTGRISAVDCDLAVIKGADNVKLLESSACSVLLKISKVRKGILNLHNSQIKNDVVIEMQTGPLPEVSISMNLEDNDSSESSSNLFLEHISALNFVQLYEGTTGKINNEPYKYVGRKFVLQPKDKKYLPSNTVLLEIQGGVIKGNIIFKGCNGEVSLSAGAVLCGEIITTSKRPLGFSYTLESYASG